MKPYSVRTLADRWECSEAHVRTLIKSGKLQSFALGGKLIRVSAEEVDKWEKPQSSSGTEENSPPHSSKEINDSAARLARMTLPSGGHGSQNLLAFKRSRQRADP